MFSCIQVCVRAFHPYKLETCSKKARKVWNATPLCLIWEIWKERNRVVFEDMPFSYSRLKNSFFSVISSCAGLLDVGDDTFIRILLFIL